jgi:hypothetical protein
MDREVFRKALEFQVSGKGKINELDSKEQNDILLKSIKFCNDKHPGKFSGYHNIIIAQEELSELQQEISKALRGKPDMIGIIEELADATIALDYIKEIFDITDRELYMARCIKLRRLNNNLLPNSDFC